MESPGLDGWSLPTGLPPGPGHPPETEQAAEDSLQQHAGLRRFSLGVVGTGH